MVLVPLNLTTSPVTTDIDEALLAEIVVQAPSLTLYCIVLDCPEPIEFQTIVPSVKTLNVK